MFAMVLSSVLFRTFVVLFFGAKFVDFFFLLANKFNMKLAFAVQCMIEQNI